MYIWCYIQPVRRHLPKQYFSLLERRNPDPSPGRNQFLASAIQNPTAAPPPSFSVMLLLQYFEIRCDSVESCQGIRVGEKIALCPNNGKHYPSSTWTKLRIVVHVRRWLSGAARRHAGVCSAAITYIVITKTLGLTLAFRKAWSQRIVKDDRPPRFREILYLQSKINR